MLKISKFSIAAIILMIMLSLTNIFGFSIAGVAVLIGIAAFFTDKIIKKQPFTDSGLDIKTIGKAYKNKKLWFLFALPLIIDAMVIVIAKLFLPDFFSHVMSRADILLSFDKSAQMIFQLAVLALGEEIAWRAFFQKQTHKVFPITPVLIASGILFGIGHFSTGSILIVSFDLFFVVVNSCVYGLIFHKTNNAWVSGISHFAANLFALIVMLII